MWNASSHEVAEIAGATPVRCRWRAAGHVVGGVIVERQMARRRPLAKIFDRGIAAVVVLRLQLEASRIAIVERDAAGVDAFGRQHVEHVAPERIAADAAHPAHLETEPRQADRDVQVGTGHALRELADFREIAGFGGHEHRHGFTVGHDIERLGFCLHDLSLLLGIFASGSLQVRFRFASGWPQAVASHATLAAASASSAAGSNGNSMPRGTSRGSSASSAAKFASSAAGATAKRRAPSPCTALQCT